MVGRKNKVKPGRQTLLQEADDLAWLRDVHGVSVAGYVCAIIYGNEDCPLRAELFARDHHKCKPTVWEYDENLRRLTLQSYGEKPKVKS